MSAVPDPAEPPSQPSLRHRRAADPSAVASAAPSAAAPSARPNQHAQPHPPQQPQQQQLQPRNNQQPPSLRSRAMAGAMGLGLVTAAVGGTYLLSENETVFPFAVAACVATFSSVLLRFALVGVTADGAQRARHRHFRTHRHFTGERAAYVRTSQRLAMMDRDFTAADYEMLLDLDNNSQRLRRFLEGASHDTVARLPTFIFKTKEGDANGDESTLGDGGKHEGVGGIEGTSGAADAGNSPELADDTAKKCTICLEDFEQGMKIRVLPCFHRFMADCIDPWLVQQARCPVCKRNIGDNMGSPSHSVGCK